MSTQIEKFRRAFPEIRRVLLEAWDPIGVRDEPHAQDEYDSYAGAVYRLLSEHAPDKAIVEYLYRVETERMGLPEHDKELLLPVVNALKKIET